MTDTPVIGIIAEYNPFHNGHAYQIQKIREIHPNAKIVVVMSGSFTQRGECAILNKWDRAEAAIMYGVDLVLELPTCYAVRSAQDFARGGVRLLNSLDIVDYLAFGTEYADVTLSDGKFLINEMAHYLESKPAQSAIHAAIQSGKSYGEAVATAVVSHFSSSIDSDELMQIMREPNTILALEYLRALITTGSTMTPLPMSRKGSNHNDNELPASSSHAEVPTVKNNSICIPLGTMYDDYSHAPIASGTAIRQALKQYPLHWEILAEVTPRTTMTALYNNYLLNAQTNEYCDFLMDDVLYRLFLYRLQQMNITELRNIYTVNEGIENRVISAVKKSSNIHEFVDIVSTRRYPATRIQRMIFYILMGITKQQIDEFDKLPPQYARILAFGADGKALLKSIKTASPIPIITKTAKFITSQDILNDKPLTDLQKMLLLDIRSTDLQSTCMNNTETGLDYTHHIPSN